MIESFFACLIIGMVESGQFCFHCISTLNFSFLPSGQCFSQICYQLEKGYSSYCRNYDESQILLEKVWIPSAKLSSFLTNASKFP